jgi:hypothetical protein
MTKKCFKCLVEKTLEYFYKHPKARLGRLNKCIECTKIDVKEHRAANLEKFREYDRSRASSEHRIELRARVTKKYSIDYPERRKANSAVSSAVARGDLKKLPCLICGNHKTVAHHTHYDSPLSVVWLCQAHHRQAHALGDKLEKEA